MTRPVKVAMALWLLLAVVVFNVTFDWETRVAGYALIRSQRVRQQQGLPALSLNDAFRPLVRGAARQGALWFVLVAAVGTAATAAAARVKDR